MRFKVCGPFRLPSDGSKLIAHSSNSRKEFWREVDELSPGLSTACGCYVFALKRGRRSKPWYVGKAERSIFSNECLAPHKRNHFNAAAIRYGGIPLLYLLPQLTPRGSFRAPTRAVRPAIRELESMLIGMGVSKNPDLLNISGTKMLRELVVEEFLNSKPSKRGSANDLRAVFE